jgi:putative acyl-CoA dehydrogenase
MLVERMALMLQASVLLRGGSPMAEAFCRSRLWREHGLVFGTLPAELNFAAFLERALPG